MTMTYVSPEGHKLIIWLSLFTALIFSIFGLRFYVITRLNCSPLCLEDGAILVSVAALLEMDGTTFWAIHNGLGAKTETLPWPQMAVIIKIALLLLYLKIFRHNAFLRRTVWILVILNVVYVIVFTSFFMTQCDHISDAWDPVLSKTNCRPRSIQEIASVAVNLLLDLLVVIPPLPSVWKLQIPVDKKIGVTIMLTIGLAVIGIMAWRLHSTIVPVEPADPVHDAYLLTIQSHLELWLGILAANMPTLGSLVNRIPVSHVKKYLISDNPSKRGPDVRLASWKGLASGSRAPRGNDFVKLPGESGISESHGGISRSQEYEVLYSRPEIA
ncbi:uncharacterized protein PG998_013233 [Apiospora kogelbergensis]|uniref:uncharacterized protein n=1 Tax=Apiospora kogelbergensis TaxID=1337665 RepID=UPI00312DBA9C